MGCPFIPILGIRLVQVVAVCPGAYKAQAILLADVLENPMSECHGQACLDMTER